MDYSPQLGQKLRPLSRAVQDAVARREIYLVLADFGRHGVAFHEAEITDDKAQTGERLIAGQYNGEILGVYRLSDGRFDNVTEDMAQIVLNALVSSGDFFEHDGPGEIPLWVEEAIPDAQAIAWETWRDLSDAHLARRAW